MSSHAPTRRDRERRLAAAVATTWAPAEAPSRLPAWVPAPLQGATRLALKTSALLAALVIAVGLFYLCLASRYDLAAIQRMPERSVVFDREGIEIATLHGESRRLISREEIPPFFVEALMAREDKRFMSHPGVDFRGLARAVLRNLRDASFTQGASTLTMQLARNSLDLGEHDLHRKALEMALAARMEARFSKDEILTAYVNRIYFGSGCHGLEEASRRYFDCPASELDDGQCALLAGIIRAPHACSPLRNPEGALAQRGEVLDRMVHEGMITASEADVIRGRPVGLASGERASTGSTATRAIRRHFETLLAAREIERGGLHLASTLDAGLQSALEAEVATILGHCPRDVEGAAVCIEPASGAIRAIVGGRSASPSSFNRAFDARRGVGSMIGPFLFAAVAERGGSLHRGESLRTGRQVEHDDFVRLAKRLGIRGPFGEGDDLYRGAVSATPLELATAAATLVNGGRRPRSHLLAEIRGGDDGVLFTSDPSLTTALLPEAAAAALENFFPRRENGRKAPPILTGGSLSGCDAWGLSFDPRFVTCIWLGHDQPQPLESAADLARLLHTALEALNHWPASR